MERGSLHFDSTDIFLVMEGQSCFAAPTLKPMQLVGITLGLYMGGTRLEQ
jgi:hypothetical protein